MQRFLLFLALSLLVVVGSASSQALGTDYFTGHTSGRIVQTTPGGVSTTLGNFGYFINGLTMDTDNKTLVAIDTLNSSLPQRVIRIDPIGPAIIGTVYSGPPLGTVQSWIEVDQDGDYLVADKTLLFKVNRNGTGLTTIFTDTSGYFFSFTEDKMSGNILIGDSSYKAILEVNRDTMAVTSIIPVVASPTGMVQDPHSAMVYLGYAGEAFKAYDPLTHVVTTLTPSLGRITPNVCGIDRAPATNGGLLYGGMTTGDIIQVDRQGTILGTVGTTGAGSCLGFILDKSRILGPELVTAPNDRRIRVNFPGDAGNSYVMAFSLAGYTPGVTLLDGRVIPLNPDLLTILTTQQGLPPILVNNLGVLNAFDEAIVTLNLNSLGPVLKGVRLWAAAVSLNSSSPLGISQISAPLLFVL